MAFGEKIAGHPYWGVVLSGALMVFVFCWASDAWMPPQWALIGGGLAATLFFVRHYWFESYWGGSVAAAGGALLVGGLGHIIRDKPQKCGISFAVGALLLYSTRVYEGAVLCGLVALVLCVQLWKSSLSIRGPVWRRLVIKNVAVLVIAAPLALWYNWRISGSATELPYTLYMQQYDLSPPFWVLPPYPPKQFSSANYRRERKWEYDMYNYARSNGALFTLTLHSAFLLIGAVWLQFLAFGLLLLGVPWARMRKGKKWLVFLAAAGIAAMLPEVSHFPHYTAPFTFVLFLLILGSMRAVWYRLATARARGPVFALASAVLFTPLAVDYATAFESPRTTERSRLIDRLESAGGRHLVFVDYSDQWPAWEPNTEWVYNGADLNSAPVLFAHLRSDRENRELLDRYRDRSAWLVRLGPKLSDVRVERYPASVGTVQARYTSE
jgi:hypothetical protein